MREEVGEVGSAAVSLEEAVLGTDERIIRAECSSLSALMGMAEGERVEGRAQKEW